MDIIAHHLDDLVCLYTFAKLGSFSSAADQLGASKAHVSNQVRRLEAALGCELLRRTTRRVSTTPEGEALLAYAEKIIELSNRAGQKMRKLRDGAGGSLRITCPVSFGEFFLPQVARELSSALPGVEMDFDLSNSVRDIVGDKLDLSFRAAPVTDADLVAKPLGRIRDVICAAPAFAGRLPKPLSADAMASVACIEHGQNPAWNEWAISVKGRIMTVRARGSYRTGNYGLMHLLCREGFGLARLPYYLAEEDLKNGALVEPFEGAALGTHELYLVSPKLSQLTKKQKIARDILLAWHAKHRERYFLPSMKGN